MCPTPSTATACHTCLSELGCLHSASHTGCCTAVRRQCGWSTTPCAPPLALMLPVTTWPPELLRPMPCCIVQQPAVMSHQLNPLGSACALAGAGGAQHQPASQSHLCLCILRHSGQRDSHSLALCIPLPDLHVLWRRAQVEDAILAKVGAKLCTLELCQLLSEQHCLQTPCKAAVCSAVHACGQSSTRACSRQRLPSSPQQRHQWCPGRCPTTCQAPPVQRSE